MKIIHPVHHGIEAGVVLVPGSAQYAPDACSVFITVLSSLPLFIGVEPPYPAKFFEIGGGVYPLAARHPRRAGCVDILSGIIRGAEWNIHISFVVECHRLLRMPVPEKVFVIV